MPYTYYIVNTTDLTSMCGVIEEKESHVRKSLDGTLSIIKKHNYSLTSDSLLNIGATPLTQAQAKTEMNKIAWEIPE